MKRFQPALLGGLFIGVLSSLPLVSALNVCCCLWVVLGGLLTVYLKQQQQPEPLETAEGVLTGLLAGVIGAFLYMLGSWLMLSITGPLWQDQVRSQLESNPDVPPQVRDMILKLLSGGGLAVMALVITLPCYAVFSSIGALLGLAFFRKKTPPAPPAVPPVMPV
jgi:hypothetical protein